MSSTYYVGTDPSEISQQYGNARFFYGLRRTDDGYLYLFKLDQLAGQGDILQINKIGDDSTKDYQDFAVGEDFFDGRLEDHTVDPAITNLNWEQFRWDSRNLFYYINDDGEFVIRVNTPWPYPANL